MKNAKLLIPLVLIPLIFVGVIVAGIFIEKTLLYIGIALLLAYIKFLLYVCLSSSSTPSAPVVIENSDMGEVNYCLDTADFDASSKALTFMEKVVRIKGIFFPSKSSRAEISRVQFSAVSPKQLEKSGYAIVNIAMYEEWARGLVDKIIENSDVAIKESVGSSQEVAKGTQVTVTLTSDDLNFEESETQTWQGKFLSFTFGARVPEDYDKNDVLFTANVYFNSVIATRLRFTASILSYDSKRLEVAREDVLSAFISYASRDRNKVASLIMGMKKARPDMDIFFDIESLRSGELWENVLQREIESRDILFLCWSQNAKESEWVDKEWRYALKNKGFDAIEPIPLVSPTVCPPPEELSAKHFNDKFLLYTQGE